MATKVFKYGALSPSSDSSIRVQMKLSRVYYNKLVEAENARRKEIWGGESPPKPPHDHTNGDSKKCEECKNFWKSMRDVYYNHEPLDLKPFRAEAKEGGLHWGSYLIAEESFAAAWKKTDCLRLLKFKSWKQGGIAGVQVQRVSLPDKKYRIEHADDPRVGRRRGQRHVIRLRVGSNEQRQPIWSDPIAFEMHRPIQGRVTWVKICMHYRGEREIWSVDITCSDIPERKDNANSGVVAIDVGWRVDEGSLRIAYATGIDGKEYKFELSPKWRELSARADRIRGIRDDRLNILKINKKEFTVAKKPKGIIGIAARHRLDVDMLMEPLPDERSVKSKKHSPKNGPYTLYEWIRVDKHLSEYEIGCRRRSEDKRRNDMRIWLRDLRRRYGFVVIKNSVHKEMKEHKKAIESGMLPPQRRNAHHAAPGEMIEEICRVWSRKTEVAIIKAGGTNTIACPKCSADMRPPDNGIWAVCEWCGAREDRDRVSTRNLLILYAQGEYEKPTARKTTARFAKRHKNSSEPSEWQRNAL